MKTQRFFVPGPLPNMNEVISAAKGYNGRGFAYKKMKEEWTGLVEESIRKAEIRPVESCTVVLCWMEKNRRRDPDNITAGGTKFVMDGLVKAGILSGDGWDYVKGLLHSWHVDKDFPGVWVEIQP